MSHEHTTRNELFRHTGLFSWLPAEHTAELAAQAEPRCLQEGDVLFRRGSASDGVYVVAEGEITFVSGHADNPEEQSVSTLEKGAYFGELSLITPGLRQSEARAALPSTLYFLSLERLQDFSRRHPESHAILMTNLARQLAGKIRHLNKEKSMANPRDLF